MGEFIEGLKKEKRKEEVKKKMLNLDIVAEGLLMSYATVLNNSIIVHFDKAHGLKTQDECPPNAFWLSDNSEKWFPAEAEIKGETVVLKSSEIKSPLYIRYAFAAMPKVNLVNHTGLPTRPFRTDNFLPRKTNKKQK